MPIPEAISRLQLCRAFRGHAVEVMDCISTKADHEVYVVDDDCMKISRFADLSESESGCFIGLNPDGRELHLLSIDNKLLSNVKGGIADCALFHSDLFAFAEFKTNAVGATVESVEDTYETAISQLENTIAMLDAKLSAIGIDLLSAVEVVCHIIVSPIFPRHSAMEMHYSKTFADRNKLELSFDNRRNFN